MASEKEVSLQVEPRWRKQSGDFFMGALVLHEGAKKVLTVADYCLTCSAG
jgi:hypothetical protein